MMHNVMHRPPQSEFVRVSAVLCKNVPAQMREIAQFKENRIILKCKIEQHT